MTAKVTALISASRTVPNVICYATMKQISATVLLLALVSGALAALVAACADNVNSAPPAVRQQRSSPQDGQGRCGWRRLVSRRPRLVRALVPLLAGLAGWGGCSPLRPAAPPAGDDPLSGLRAFENQTRSKTDFAHARTSDSTFGPDPYVLRAAPWDDGAGKPRLLGLLRGRNALVELDESLKEVTRLPAPESPTGLAVAADGEVFVVGELSSHIARYARVGGRAPACRVHRSTGHKGDA